LCEILLLVGAKGSLGATVDIIAITIYRLSAADKGTQQAMGDAALRPAHHSEQSDTSLNPYQLNIHLFRSRHVFTLLEAELCFW